jgi:hypothetical protein
MFNETAVEIGKRFGISAVNYTSPLAFYERVADRLIGMDGYSGEMTFLITLIHAELTQEILDHYKLKADHV